MRWAFLIFIVLLSTSDASGFNVIAKLAELFGNLVLTLSSSQEWNRDAREFANHEVPSSGMKNYDTYDFVIVGAGSAGCTLAARLSEIPDVRVLLIEAGDHENLLMDVPLGSLALPFVKQLNYGYKTEKSTEYCRGMSGGRCLWPMGRVTGGNSAFNFMVATRGHQEDYDNWARETGDASWDYEHMLGYFKKLEKFDLEGEQDYHGYDGPVHVSRSSFKSTFQDSFMEAGEEVFGLPVNMDYNGERQMGFSPVQSTIWNNERWSANRAYLHPARHRGNLKVTRNTRATKILIRNNTAYGVTFVKKNLEYDIYASREVILTAGAIETPKLLMLSGVGPKKHLREMGIKCIHTSPGVGENLLDHPVYAGLVFLTKKGTGLITASVINPFNQHISNYLRNRKGALANPVFNALGTVSTSNDSSPYDRPDVELLFSSGTLVQDAFGHHILGISNEYWNNYFAKILQRDAFMILPTVMKPKSRGKLLLRSVDAADKPRLYPNYFKDKSDLDTLVRGIRMAVKIGKSRAMERHDTRLYEKPVPGCDHHEYDSDGYWECAVRTFGTSGNDHAGTCRMGLRDDPMAVVDSKLRVIGVDNLRIGDASVMPSIPAAHINLPIIAVAEKLADMVKKDHGFA